MWKPISWTSFRRRLSTTPIDEAASPESAATLSASELSLSTTISSTKPRSNSQADTTRSTSPSSDASVFPCPVNEAQSSTSAIQPPDYDDTTPHIINLPVIDLSSPPYTPQGSDPTTAFPGLRPLRRHYDVFASSRKRGLFDDDDDEDGPDEASESPCVKRARHMRTLVQEEAEYMDLGMDMEMDMEEPAGRHPAPQPQPTIGPDLSSLVDNDTQMGDNQQGDKQSDTAPQVTNQHLHERLEGRDTQLEELWHKLQTVEHQLDKFKQESRSRVQAAEKHLVEIRDEAEALSKRWRRLKNKFLAGERGRNGVLLWSI